MNDGNNIQIIVLEALAHLQRGDAARALDSLTRDPEVMLRHEFPCYVAGLIHAGRGECEMALSYYDRALALRSDYPEALYGRALMLQELGRAREACAVYDEFLKSDPEDATAWHNRAVLLVELGDSARAMEGYRKALELRPGYAPALYGAASAAQSLGLHRDALKWCAEYLACKPDDVEALILQGNLLHKMRRFEEALSSLDEAAGLAPRDPRVLSNKGVALHSLGRRSEAAESFDAALAEKPDLAEAWLGRGNVALRSQRLEDALAAFDRVLELNPGDNAARCGRAMALRDLGRLDEAMADFDRAIAAEPAYADARANRAMLRLLLGDFERGWEDYEYRWVLGETPKTEVDFPWPEWTGGPIAGKTVLVLDEAGLGDLLMLARYLPMLVERDANVVVQCRKHMHAILRSAAPFARFVVRPHEAGPVDYCAPILSLPRAFKTRPGAEPADVPYLWADRKLAAKWAERLGPHGFKIGLCWRGSSHHSADSARSVALSDCAPLAAIDGVRLIALQKNGGAEEVREAGIAIETLGDDFDAGPDAFMDSAAVMASLDLVLTIDTSIAHLAGALGRPVWVALKSIPEWRWMLGREDTPWYPTMRLFRQRQRGEWRPVFERMAGEVRRICAARAKCDPVV